MNKIIELLKEKPYIIPSKLLMNYRKLDISEKELIIIIYLINSDLIFDSIKISKDLNYDHNEVLKMIDNLDKKSLAKIEVKRENDKMIEYINLDTLYNKLGFLVMDRKDKVNTSVFEVIEQEFGRTLSPMEYDIVNEWKEKGFKDDIIIAALNEAIYNGVTNTRYINTILYEWRKKGINEVSDIKIKNKKETKKELFEYDWLNEDE